MHNKNRPYNVIPILKKKKKADKALQTNLKYGINLNSYVLLKSQNDIFLNIFL